MDRFEQLEAKINKQRKTNRMLALALLVSFSLSASNYEWVKSAWAQVVTYATLSPSNPQNGFVSTTMSTTAPAIMGANTASAGSAIKGNSVGASGIGVHGWAGASGGMGIAGVADVGTGVYGTVTSPTTTGKSGVYGINMTTSYGGNGVYGEARGSADKTSYGVYGYQNGSTASLVSAAGVYGLSNNAYGVKGHSSLVQGGFFATSSGNGQINLAPSSLNREDVCVPGDLRAEKFGDLPPYNYFLLFCGSGSEWHTVALE